MQVDGTLGADLANAGSDAHELEAVGYTGVWTAETAHDPFLPLLLAAEHTTDLQLGTSIAVAFARNPMTLAHIGWDLQRFSGGRFTLGLGSQIKPHITKRFSMEWSHPAPRMREMVLAIRAIWDTWLNGTPLQFRGEFYTHTLMTPFFAPDASELGRDRPAEDLPGGCGRADDRGGRRGVRRVLLPRVHHREVPPRGHPAGPRTRTGEGRQVARRLRDRRPVVRRHRERRGGDVDGGDRPPASRSRSTVRPRPTARCSRCTAGATSRIG